MSATTTTTTTTTTMDKARSMLEENPNLVYRRVSFLPNVRRISKLAHRLTMEEEEEKQDLQEATKVTLERDTAASPGKLLHPSKQHMIEWALEGLDLNEEDRMDAYELALSLPLLRVKKGKGFVFGHPTSKKTDDDEEESLQSMLIVNEIDPPREFQKEQERYREVMHRLQHVCMFLKMKTADHPTNTIITATTQTILERLDRMEQNLKQLHERYGPKDKHWLVANLGLSNNDKNHESNSSYVHGEELMRQLCGMADAARRSCYVECASEEHRSFFEQYGFRVVGSEPIHHDTQKEKPTSSLTVFLMVRETEEESEA